MTSETIKSTALVWLKHIEAKECTWSLPITKINNVCVNVNVYFSNLKKCSREAKLTFTSPLVNCYHENSYLGCIVSKQYPFDSKWSLEMIEEVIMFFRSEMNALVFNKKCSLFLSTYNNKDLQNLEEIFSLSNVKFSDGICGVCKEETNCRTPCGHHLCMCCFSNLEFSNSTIGVLEEDEVSGSKCPSCSTFMKRH